MDINIDALYNILKQNQDDVNDSLGYKKKAVMVTSDPLALVAKKTKVSKRKEKVEVQTDSEGSDDENISDLKKTTALLAKAFNQKKYYAKPKNNNLRTSSASFSANKKPKYVKSIEKKEDKKADEKKWDMSKVKCYKCKKEGHFSKDCKKAKVKDYNYYKTKMLLAKKDSDEQVLLAEDQAWMESNSNESSSSAKETIAKEERYEYMIRYSALCDNDKQHRKKIDEQEILFDKMSHQLVEMNNNVLRLQDKILEKETKISELEGCISNKDVEIEKCLERLNEYENKLHKIEQTIQTSHMIMPSKDTLYNGRKGIGFENPSYFEKVKDLRPSLYDEKVIGLGYTLMFLIHSDEALEIEKFKRARQTNSLKPYVPNVILEKIIIDLEDEVANLLEREKVNLETIKSLKSKGFESSENAISETENQSENDCQVVDKECDNVENPNVIAPVMFKLSVSQSVSPISVTKTSCDYKNVENKTKKRHLDTFSSVRRPKKSIVIWKKKGLSNTYNVDLSFTRSAYVCNDAMNVSCISRLCDSFDENNLFIFDDESVRISLVNKMPFKKKPRDSMNVRSKRNSSKPLPRTVHRWLSKMQPLAKPVAKWIPRIVQICLWIIDSGCSKHMMGNHALLTNFAEKFLGTVRFGNNDFVVIASYGDVVIGSMTIKKVYYVEGLGHNLFSVGQFCDKGLEVAFRMSTCFVQNKYGVDFLTGGRSLNLYTIALNEVASNSSTYLLAKASSSQSGLWHQPKVKDYEYYKTKMLLAKKEKDEQVLLAEDHAWM
nr:integrase, catalytic region, zinc finger, CCHC-type, peptidase aspartic, catalytic [Tanacetum cinerariifolium]